MVNYQNIYMSEFRRDSLNKNLSSKFYKFTGEEILLDDFYKLGTLFTLRGVNWNSQ